MAKVKLTDGKSGSIHRNAADGETLELNDAVLPGFGTACWPASLGLLRHHEGQGPERAISSAVG
jgi:hypothetical protein